MTMYYDTNLFKFFKDKAVSSPDQLVPGNTYYSNHEGEFIFLRLEEDEIGLKIINNKKHIFCRDHNIGASYSPWLIFTDKDWYLDCVNRLKISYEKDTRYPYYFEKD